MPPRIDYDDDEFDTLGMQEEEEEEEDDEDEDEEEEEETYDAYCFECGASLVNGEIGLCDECSEII
jgi:hypothetical protein